jgi:predicted DNA-binding ribbon-helix-helix protein
MSKLLSELAVKSCAIEVRSFRLGSHTASIGLEVMFWDILEKIAAEEREPLDQLLSKIHDDTLRFQGEVDEFTSLLRCACLSYVESMKQVLVGLGPPSDKG